MRVASIWKKYNSFQIYKSHPRKKFFFFFFYVSFYVCKTTFLFIVQCTKIQGSLRVALIWKKYNSFQIYKLKSHLRKMEQARGIIVRTNSSSSFFSFMFLSMLIFRPALDAPLLDGVSFYRARYNKWIVESCINLEHVRDLILSKFSNIQI